MRKILSMGFSRLSALGVLGLVGVAAATGCVGSDVEDGATGVATQRIYYIESALWTMRDIPVCYMMSGFSTEKTWVREALQGQRSWAQAGNVNFVGWGSCDANFTTGIRIWNGQAQTLSLGMDDGPINDMLLDFGSSPQTLYTTCIANSLTREACIKAVALHEFGHALGYSHEHNRDDTPASCTQAPQGDNGDTTFDEWDADAVMNYCATTTDLSATERVGTDRLYGPRNGDDRHLRDYNGDGKVDLLCHDVVAGTVTVDYAGSTSHFDGTDFSAAGSWCAATSTRRVFTGDFNGDGRTDLLCLDVASGSEYIDYASASGQFGGTDWSWAGGWCNATDHRQLFVADFNGDGRDDQLCFDYVSGARYIDYADASGHFDGSGWSNTTAWCNATSTRRLFVGDFNGDGRADLYCHDFVTGEQFVDIADASGHFNGTNWSQSIGFCNGNETRQLVIGDFNGDGRSDLLCYDAKISGKWISYATSSGTFGGIDVTINNAWCTSQGTRLYVGDVNGDGRDDLICHNVKTGAKHVDYASLSGSFAGTDWSTSTSWCGDDANELH